jgi:methionyl-tRNA formyltransferase
MQAILIGAVEGSRVALDAFLRAPDWRLAAVATLPPDLSHRHSDFVDIAGPAAAAGVETIFVRNVNSPDFLETLSRLAVDMVFVIGWSQLCGPAFRAAAGGRVIGYHPAPLPRLRGRAVIPWTILLDEKITASTLFTIDDDVDSGEILGQRFFHVAPDETAGTLYQKHMAALADLLGETLPRLARGNLAGTVQDPRLATWAARRRPEDGRIDWSRPAHEVQRLIRAAGRPYPGAFSECGGQRIVLWSAEPAPAADRHHALPGQVLARSGESFSVRCGDGGALRVTEWETPDGSPPRAHSILGAA